MARQFRRLAQLRLLMSTTSAPEIARLLATARMRENDLVLGEPPDGSRVGQQDGGIQHKDAAGHGQHGTS